MTRTGAAARPPLDLDERAETFFEWIQLHSRHVAIGLGIVVAAGITGYLYIRSQASRERRAYESLVTASAAVDAKNWALAQNDLERLVQRYEGTAAGQQAALLLSEVLYATGKYQQGIDQLTRLAAGADADVRAVAEAQIAAGYEDLKNFPEAARHYTAAAERARFEPEKALYMADAARAYTAAGNPEAAKRIWSELAEDDAGPVAGEARIRLGELEAQVAKRM
ncbi:MAG: tetratricopeptide repeat protein [Gemmatimonadota bacterium]|nr:tetratricopeptide repeat protein [Gemmatimonadota bacterium]